jgi:proline iminopeptidase
MSPDDWPDPVKRGFDHINPDIYVKMQGPSELGLKGTLEDWDRTDELHLIEVPTLVLAATHDTMDPAYMRKMAGLLPKGRYFECPEGSHLAIFDDQERYFAALTDFILDVDREA